MQQLKICLALSALLVLVGCGEGPSGATVTRNGFVQRGLDQTPGLSDCTAFQVAGEMVIRCPNSSTATVTHHGTSGNRHTDMTVVIDGVTYQPAK